NVATGAGSEQMALWQSKAAMKPLYAAAGVPTARQVMVADPDEVRAFAGKVGYPLFAKPERGVGAGGTAKITDEAALDAFLASLPSESYVLEEFVTGDICSYEAILDSKGNPLFENQSEYPVDIASTVEDMLDVWYYTCPTVDPELARLARATAKAFGIKSRFVHMEFFRLTADKPGLGKKGDYVGLEVNVRAPGGYDPDMVNFAHSFDLYKIWADMVAFDASESAHDGETFYCVYASQRDCHAYMHTHQEIMDAYGSAICMQGRMADILSDDLGNDFYMVRLKSIEDGRAFAAYVHERRS
ncbi:MAG: hypothetical protein J6D34_04765, partial [Atopobiaceae bacterium]|nr:hypothetical protein [Atopobiaceae bacterium]